MTKSLTAAACFALACTLAVSGCKSTKQPAASPPENPAPNAPPPPAPTPAPPPPQANNAPGAPAAGAKAEAQTIFSTRCVACHGADGKGDGAAAAALNPKPQNYTDPAWQQKVTDKEIETAILKGGAAVGRSPLMPPNPDLEGKPEVVAALKDIVRGFGPKK